MPNLEDRPKRYFSIHYILLRILGLGWWHHSDEEDTRNFHGWYLYYSIVTQLVWVVGFVGLETIDPFIGEKDLERFMFSLSFVITHDLTLIKLYLFYFRNKEIQDIVRTIEIELPKYYQNPSKTLKTIRSTKIITGAFLFFGWVTIGNSNVYGAIQDFGWRAEVAKYNDTSEPRTLPQPIYIPWNYQKDSSYIPTFALETVGLLWTGHIVMTIDTFIASLILHMSSQFAIIQEAISTVYERTISDMSAHLRRDYDNYSVDGNVPTLKMNDRIVREKYTEKEIEEALERSVKKCLRHHQVLISCTEKFSQTYAYGFLTQLLSSMAAICVVMVQVSQDASSLKSIRLVTSLSFFAAMTLQLAIQCYAGNELTIEAGRVSGAIMRCGWERMGVRARRLLLVPMLRAQRPLALNAAGFATINNACFLSIMKAAYSYYAVLSQKQKTSTI